jgi:DNA-binding transcriptional LysR family regulator
MPQLEHEPEQHRVIRYGSSPWEPGSAWLEQRAAAVRAIFFADDMPTVREACAAHVGLAVLPHFYAAPTRLRLVADDVDRAGLYVAVHSDLKRVPRVRAVVSWLGAAVAERVATSLPKLNR